MNEYCKIHLPGESSVYGIYHNTRVKRYPDGSADILCASKQVFRMPGYEERGARQKPTVRRSEGVTGDADNLLRAKRRARAEVRDLALCNPMRWFVTLTLDKEKIDRYDEKVIVQKMGQWADNHVRRDGLKYILVPEHHGDGAIHFHGFFNDALKVIDSGTMTAPGWKKPRRPKSVAEREKWAADGARPVYNLPAWTYGFTTAIEVYGDYHAAVGYVCKYIAKEGDKIGGRWYYHGGRMEHPEVEYLDSDFRQVASTSGAATFETDTLDGIEFALVRVDAGGCGKEGEQCGKSEKILHGGV